MNRQEFFDRYRVWTRRADDPLNLRGKKSRMVAVRSFMLGAALCTFVQTHAQANIGQHSIQSYVEVRLKDDKGLWSIKDVIPCATVVFFTSGTSGTTATSFPGWDNNNNTVEVIGGGGNGGPTSGCIGGSGSMGSGGGGGGYALKNNITLGATFSFQIGAATGQTWFSSSGTVAANGGASGSNGVGIGTVAGGAGGAGSAGTTLHTGGTGGQGLTTGLLGGGGGSSAGPTSNGNGGSVNTGGAQVSGSWTATAGGTAHPGAGGDGGNNGAGNSGALYGGGGGGGAGTIGSGGGGAQGIAIATYVPLKLPYNPWLQRGPLMAQRVALFTNRKPRLLWTPAFGEKKAA
jgi:hypothetical protein